MSTWQTNQRVEYGVLTIKYILLTKSICLNEEKSPLTSVIWQYYDKNWLSLLGWEESTLTKIIRFEGGCSKVKYHIISNSIAWSKPYLKDVKAPSTINNISFYSFFISIGFFNDSTSSKYSHFFLQPKRLQLRSTIDRKTRYW